MDTPYRIERSVKRIDSSYVTSYSIYRTGDGELCHGSDPVFMHHIVELLNEEENNVEGR